MLLLEGFLVQYIRPVLVGLFESIHGSESLFHWVFFLENRTFSFIDPHIGLQNDNPKQSILLFGSSLFWVGVHCCNSHLTFQVLGGLFLLHLPNIQKVLDKCAESFKKYLILLSSCLSFIFFFFLRIQSQSNSKSIWIFGCLDSVMLLEIKSGLIVAGKMLVALAILALTSYRYNVKIKPSYVYLQLVLLLLYLTLFQFYNA